MTRDVKHNIRCLDCSIEVECPKCSKKRPHGSPFSSWFRELESPLSSKFFDNENLDYIWFQYRQGWLITIEEKQEGGRSTQAQTDTHNIIAQMLVLGSKSPVRTMRGVRKVEYRGHYVVSFQNTTPDDSDWIEINGTRAEPKTIFVLLKNGHIDNVSNGIQLPTDDELAEWEEKEKIATQQEVAFKAAAEGFNR